MKTINLIILGVTRTLEGGIAVKTKETAFNKSKDNSGFAFHKLTQAQAERMANITIGAKNINSLFQALRGSINKGTVSFEVKSINRGDSWVNTVTGETAEYDFTNVPEGVNTIQRGQITDFQFSQLVQNALLVGALQQEATVSTVAAEVSADEAEA